MTLPSRLTLLDHVLVRSVARLVPLADRNEWLRAWHAEIWYLRSRQPPHSPGSLRASLASTLASNLDLTGGLVRDALWLRSDLWRRTFSGTPLLCLVSLLCLCVPAAALLLLLGGRSDVHTTLLRLLDQAARCVFAAPLVLFVSALTSAPTSVALHTSGTPAAWLNRKLFFVAKTSLSLILAFLVSVDLARPIYDPLPNLADLFQVFFFVSFALFVLRWAFLDQDARCKQCLRSLATPARVGRPSHNLLEWNGTELTCRDGHGLLSVPEIATSWCRGSRWIQAPSDLEGA